MVGSTNSFELRPVAVAASTIATGVFADPGARKLVQDVLDGPVSGAVADAINLEVDFDIVSPKPSITALG